AGPGAGSPAPEPMAPAPAAQPLEEARVFAGLEGAEEGLLLLDPSGQVLGGALKDPAGRDVTDAVAAYLAGVSQEAGPHRQAARPGTLDRTRGGRPARPRPPHSAHGVGAAARGARARGSDGAPRDHRPARRPRGAPLAGGAGVTTAPAEYGR